MPAPAPASTTSRACAEIGCDEPALGLFCEGHGRRREQRRVRSSSAPPPAPVARLEAVADAAAEMPLYKAPREYKPLDVDGAFGCKLVGCTGRTRTSRGAFAYLCDEHKRERSSAHGAAVAAGRWGAKSQDLAESQEPQVRQQPPLVWAVKVPGTGLRYRSADEALVAAEEIEQDGEDVARRARVEGNEGKADQAIDAARELAERIRIAAAAASGHATCIQEPAADGLVEPSAEAIRMQEPCAAAAEPPDLGAAALSWVRATRSLLDAVEAALCDPDAPFPIRIRRLD